MSRSNGGSPALRARVTVYPRREVLDPQGKAILQALVDLGYRQVTEVHAGKSFELALAGDDREAARASLDEMCRRLLANPLIERYEIELAGAAEERP